MSDLARLNPLADLRRELPRKILPLERPEVGLMILVGVPAQLDVDRAAASSGIVIGEHRRIDLFIGDRRLVPTDIGGVAQNVGSAILIDRGDSLDAALMPRLHGQEAVFGMLILLIDVDKLVMHMVEQHQVVDVVREQW
jgi:hypothetical protein